MNTGRIVGPLLLLFGSTSFVTTSVLAEPFQLEEARIADFQEAFASGELTSEMLVMNYLDRIMAYDQQGTRLNTIICSYSSHGGRPETSSTLAAHRFFQISTCSIVPYFRP